MTTSERTILINIANYVLTMQQEDLDTARTHCPECEANGCICPNHSDAAEELADLRRTCNELQTLNNRLLTQTIVTHRRRIIP